MNQLMIDHPEGESIIMQVRKRFMEIGNYETYKTTESNMDPTPKASAGMNQRNDHPLAHDPNWRVNGQPEALDDLDDNAVRIIYRKSDCPGFYQGELDFGFGNGDFNDDDPDTGATTYDETNHHDPDDEPGTPGSLTDSMDRASGDTPELETITDPDYEEPGIPVEEEVIARIESIAYRLRSGEMELQTAMSALAQLLVDVPMMIHDNPTDQDEEIDSPVEEAEGDDEAQNVAQLFGAMKEDVLALKSLGLDCTEDHEPAIMLAQLAADRIRSITDRISREDLLVELLMNPRSDDDKIFRLAALEDESTDYVALLSYSTSNYTNHHAITHWLDVLDGMIVGGIGIFDKDSTVKIKKEDGKWTLDFTEDE